MLFWLLAAFFIAHGIILLSIGKLTFVANHSLLIGGLSSSVAIPILARMNRNSLDEALGAMSYGCYLSHWVFVSLLGGGRTEWWLIAIVIGASVASGYLSFVFIEAPTVTLRRSLRRRVGPAAKSAVP
jgi:peptidoglycan/LPS O-acetylase OafA/YrhL